jgi:thiamine biosynthesis protein ThiI
MEKYDAVIVHFGEIWLKGRNRSRFIKILLDNIEHALNHAHSADAAGKVQAKSSSRKSSYKISMEYDRVIVYFSKKSKKSDFKAALERLSSVFGISWFAPCIICENRLDKIIESANAFPGIKDAVIRLEAHRSYKNLDFDSRGIVSYFLENAEMLKFSLDSKAGKTLHINPTEKGCFLFLDKILGAGGLPVGSSGKAVILLSGGIDSPVAAYYAMKRGLKPIYLHAHAFSDNKEAKRSEKMKELGSVLRKYSSPSKIYFIPSHLFQTAAMGIPKKYEHVLFKRFLLEAAAEIAQSEGAKAIASGESLGQVSSQTLQNLIASDPGTGLLLIRPLIGMDKQEIINKAKQINTFEYSILKYKDVCSIIVRDPATNIKKELIDRLYKNLNLQSILSKTLKKSLVAEF